MKLIPHKPNLKAKEYGKFAFVMVCGGIVICAMSICYWFQVQINAKEKEMKSNWKKYDAAVTKLDDTMNTLRKKILSNAEESYESDGYEAAIKIIDSGLDMLDNDKELLAAREKYENLKPVSLDDLNPTDYGDDYTSWDLNGAYKKFTGQVSASADSSNSWYNATVVAKIYGDDQLLYTSEALTSDPQEFNLDVSGVSSLKVVWESQSVLDFWYDVSNYGTITDGQLTKAID